MLFLLNRENYKFLLHWQWLCPTHKGAAAARCPWIIASRSRCCSAETNSSDKICRRLIVYSCFMARCNLNTFMISLKARWRQRSLPSEAVERKGGFILTSGFISPVWVVISLYARRLRGRPSLTREMQQFLPPLSFSALPAPIFISAIFFFFWVTELFRFVQMSCFHFPTLEVEIESDPAWPSSITQAKLRWMCSLDHCERGGLC